VSDVDDVNDDAIVVDLVDDAVVTAPGRPQTRETAAQLMTNAVRRLGQRTGHELVAGDRDALRQFGLDRTTCTP
jgi:hypothetical protein